MNSRPFRHVKFRSGCLLLLLALVSASHAITSEEMDQALDSPGLEWTFDNAAGWSIDPEGLTGNAVSLETVDEVFVLSTNLVGEVDFEFWVKVELIQENRRGLEDALTVLENSNSRLSFDAEETWLPFRIRFLGEQEKTVGFQIGHRVKVSIDKVSVVPHYRMNLRSYNGSIAVIPAGGDYAEGQLLELTAVPDPGWTFSHWAGEDGVNYSPTIQVDYEFDGNYHYARMVRDFEYQGSTFQEGGTRPWIMLEAGGLSAGHSFSEQWLEKQIEGPAVVQVKGTFDGRSSPFGLYVDHEAWEYFRPELEPVPIDAKVPIPEGTHTFSMEAGNGSVDAELLIDTLEIHTGYPVNINQSAFGTIEISPDKVAYQAGETVTLKATSNEGFAFAGWIGSTVTKLIPQVNEVSFAVTRPEEISATFLKIDESHG